jgi:superfamily II DNA or RNA helicase
MNFSLSSTSQSITLRPVLPGLIERVFHSFSKRELDNPSQLDARLCFAIADARALAEQLDDLAEIASDHIVLGHRVASALDADSSEQLGLPPLTEYTLRTDVDGLIGSPQFGVRYEWYANGVQQFPERVGCLLKGASGLRRLPLFILEAIEVAEAFKTGTSDHHQHWEVLARFRSALTGAEEPAESEASDRCVMSGFLSGLEVKLVDCLSLSPKTAPDGRLDFDIIPFSKHSLEVSGDVGDVVSENHAELRGEELQSFQNKTKERGALPAYRISPRSYVVVDRAVAPALELMVRMSNAEPDEREHFVRNPKVYLAAVYEDLLRKQGRLESLNQAGEEEAVERAVEPVFVETREFSERVIGIQRYVAPEAVIRPSGTTWLPEGLDPGVADILLGCDAAKLGELHDKLVAAAREASPSVDFAGRTIVPSPELETAVSERLHALQATSAQEGASKPEEDQTQAGGPIVVVSQENYEEILFQPKHRLRSPEGPVPDGKGLRSTLKPHQLDALLWQVRAWRAGLPGVLNADEQGLGKTIETLAFLKWTRHALSADPALSHGPILVVAPTSLLENWERECDQHLDEHGLGHLLRLYGTKLSGFKAAGAKGTDIGTGESKLDFELLQEAIQEGRGHRFWILTTYTTLTNYQHSFAKIRFSVVVFDEIQNLKNPFSLRSCAARALNGDFRIGLTGTPIENETPDLWAVMDQLSPGSLDSLKTFRETFGQPSEDNMRQLYGRVFLDQGDLPALAIRRTKAEAAKDLPAKRRCILPKLMPPLQEQTYDLARLKLEEKTPGGALKLLHHIRTISVHPRMSASMEDEEFKTASARLHATIEILRRIETAGQRALVFIESRKMQERFIQIIRRAFRLSRVDLINGDTPIQQRQRIVERFQRHLHQDGGFDLLVLGPKAAGTGLTLTAATHVIHLSRWWNPAVEEQCNDRVHRIGQRSDVLVHVPMAIHPRFREHSFDCLLQSLMTRKRRLAAAALWPAGDTQGDVAYFGEALKHAELSSDGDPLRAAVKAMFARDGEEPPEFDRHGVVFLNE